MKKYDLHHWFFKRDEEEQILNKNKEERFMINLFPFTNKRVGVNILWSSYLTYQAEQEQLTVKDKS